MQAKNVIYNLKNLKAQGKPSDEMEISDFQWMYMIDYYRSMLIKQQQRQGQSINPFIIQEFPLVLKKEGCDVVSSIILPKPIELHNWEMITRVADGYNQRSTQYATNWLEYTKFTSNECTWYIKQGKLYMRNYYGNTKTTIEGVWESPYDVELIKGSINELDPLAFEYPISSTMLDQLYKLIVDAEFRILGLPKDNFNNSNEDSQQ